MIYRILIAEDHPVVRQGFRALLEAAGHQVVGEASNGRAACELAGALRPNVALLDLAMPLLNGIDASREIQHVSPETKSILLTAHVERSFVLQALRANVRGYVLKIQAADDLLRALQEVMNGAVYISPNVAACLVDAALGKTDSADEALTARERQVLQLVAEGKSTKGCANILGISVKTAEAHRNRIMQKLDIHQTAGLVHYAIRRGLTPL
jgi:two-component system, NarL family, response regulator NreC